MAQTISVIELERRSWENRRKAIWFYPFGLQTEVSQWWLTQVINQLSGSKAGSKYCKFQAIRSIHSIIEDPASPGHCSQGDYCIRRYGTEAHKQDLISFKSEEKKEILGQIKVLIYNISIFVFIPI